MSMNWISKMGKRKGEKLSMLELERKSVQEFKNVKKMPIVVVLDNMRSLHNVGSVFRTADAFSIEKIILCGITAQPPHRDIQKTALGATESVEWEYEDTTLSSVKKLREEGYRIIGVEQVEDSTFLEDYSTGQEQKLALIFGNEVKGVGQEVLDHCDEYLEIPQSGTKHSLNISVSVGVVLWELTKKLGA